MTNPDKNKKLVMVFGTFDYLHAGHENFFAQAKRLGDEILVVLARDKTVKTIKGEKPMFDEKQRLKNLLDTGWVKEIILGEIKDKMKVIKTHKPQIIALGYDQYAFTYNLEKMIIDLKLDTKIVRLESYNPHIYKSSILKKNMEQKDEKNTKEKN